MDDRENTFRVTMENVYYVRSLYLWGMVTKVLKGVALGGPYRPMSRYIIGIGDIVTVKPVAIVLN